MSLDPTAELNALRSRVTADIAKKEEELQKQQEQINETYDSKIEEEKKRQAELRKKAGGMTNAPRQSVAPKIRVAMRRIENSLASQEKRRKLGIWSKHQEQQYINKKKAEYHATTGKRIQEQFAAAKALQKRKGAVQKIERQKQASMKKIQQQKQQIAAEKKRISGLMSIKDPKQRLDRAISYSPHSSFASQYVKMNVPSSKHNLLTQYRAIDSRSGKWKYADGSKLNVAKNRIKNKLFGGSDAEFQRRREAEIKNRQQALKQSAGLRASGQSGVGTRDFKAKQNFQSGFTVSSKEQGFKTTGQAEIERQKKVEQQKREKQIKESSKDPIKTKKTGTGTTTDPFVAQQPDKSKVSSFLKGAVMLGSGVGGVMNDTGTERYEVTTPDGKKRTFKDKKTADKFIARTKGNYVTGSMVGFSPSGKSYQGPPKPKRESVDVPVGTLEAIYGKPKGITAKTDSKEFLPNLGVELYNSLRYYDRVQNKEVSEPKGLEFLPYYASKALKPIVDIPLNLAGERTAPTLGSTVFDTGLQLATKGKTETHDPIGDYIKKDPLGTLFEIPAEAALWITGTKATQAGSKAIRLYSPLRYQKSVIAVSKDKYDVIYRGMTWKNKPIFGVQSGKIVTKKSFDYSKIPFAKINPNTREGAELALGSGVERDLFYSGKSQSTQVSARVIPPIAEKRVTAWVSAVDDAMKITSKPGMLGSKPISGLTQKQADDVFAKAVKSQKKKDVDLIHGSAATRSSIPESIQKEAGSSLILGDIDIIPKGGNLAVKADKLIQTFAKDFPLEKGQRLVVEGVGKGETTNRALKLFTQGEKEPKKFLEVVLRGSDESKYGIGKGDKILGYNIPFKKSQTVKDYGIKTTTADYQLLTNVKQVLAYQPGKDTLFDIHASSGRFIKDTVRGYWNLKGKAFFKGGESGKQLDIKAERIRKLYPEIADKFTDYTPEKVLLYSSRLESKSPSSIQSRLSGSSLMTKQVLPKVQDSIKSDSIKTDSIKLKSGDSLKSVKLDSKIDSIKGGSKTKVDDLGSIADEFSKRTTRSIVNRPSSRVISNRPISQKPTSRTISNKPASRILGSKSASIKESIDSFKTGLLGSQKPQSTEEPPTLSVKTPSIKSPPSSIKTPTLNKPPSRPPTMRPPTIRLTNKQKSFLDTKSRKGLGPAIPWRTDKSFGVPRGTKIKRDYIGNVPVDKVSGIFKKRSETTYDESKISLFTSQTKRKPKRIIPSFLKSNRKSKSFLSL